MTRIDLPRKSRSRIHAAEGFLPLQAIKGVDSVWKIETGLNCTLRFQSGPSSPFKLLCMSTVNLCFLSNHWPLSSPVSCFGTDLMPLNTLDCRKYSAARMGVCDFEPDPHLLCCAREQCFTNISTADDYFRALFRDSWSELNQWMRTLVENTPLLESEPSDLNPTLLTKQSSVKILSLDNSFCMKITLS